MAKKPQLPSEEDQSAISGEEAPMDETKRAEVQASVEAGFKKLKKSAAATEIEPLQERLLAQALSGPRLQIDKDPLNWAALSALSGIAPKDGLEGMLAAQMVATNDAGAECFRRAGLEQQSLEGLDIYLKHGVKLKQLYLRQMEALAKHRGRGQQKITVEHVNVHAGGQAIVGNVKASPSSLSRTASAPLALSHASENGVPLPDAMTTPARAKQRVRKSSK